MKPLLIANVLIPALLAAGASAQDENAAVETNSSLQVSGGLQFESRTDQERIEFLHKVAQAYFTEGDLDNAINAYERILAIDPVNREARFIVAHVYITSKQYAKAEALLKKLIDEYPEDFHLKNNLAWLYATAEDHAYRNGEQAIKLAQEAMILAPNDHHVWSTLSEAYYVTGQYEKAFRAIEHMARLATKYGQNITQEMVEGYNEQIQKCKRAWDTQKALEEDTESEEES